MLTDRIYYTDQELLELIKSEFDFVDDKGWFELYKQKQDGTFWRLDKWDKYQTQFFVRLETIENWESVDDSELRVELLKTTRGVDLTRKCIWNNCENFSLQGLVYCEKHAYFEMGIRK